MPLGFQLLTERRARAAVGFAVAQLGKPHVWGASAPTAFDCSGWCKPPGLPPGSRIARTTSTQVHDGAPVAGMDQIQPGDLLFIPGGGGSATHPGHVGLYAGAGLVIGAYDPPTA